MRSNSSALSGELKHSSAATHSCLSIRHTQGICSITSPRRAVTRCREQELFFVSERHHCGGDSALTSTLSPRLKHHIGRGMVCSDTADCEPGAHGHCWQASAVAQFPQLSVKHQAAQPG